MHRRSCAQASCSALSVRACQLVRKPHQAGYLLRRKLPQLLNQLRRLRRKLRQRVRQAGRQRGLIVQRLGW